MLNLEQKYLNNLNLTGKMEIMYYPAFATIIIP